MPTRDCKVNDTTNFYEPNASNLGIVVKNFSTDPKLQDTVEKRQAQAAQFIQHI
jgi:hypothetical protein